MHRTMGRDNVIASVCVGNTTTAAAIFVGGALVRTTRVPTIRLREIWRLFGRVSDDFRERTTAVIVGSVVPGMTEAAAEIASGEFDAPARLYRVDVPAGLEIRVEKPERVGDDRLANALAAHARARGAAVVVDLGTAMTVDAVSKDGAFLGGAIFPGANTGGDALAKRTALLPRVELEGTLTLPGNNTEQAVRAGLLYGAAGAVDRLIERTWDALGGETSVIGTGGEAKLVAPLTTHLKVENVEPALTLEGLQRAVTVLLSATTQEIAVPRAPK
jgi:type III pantothenate kinase